MSSKTIYNKIQCNLCDKEFLPRGMFTHLMRIHGTDDQKSIYTPGICRDPENTKTKIKAREFAALYNESPKKCKQCNKSIRYNRRYNNFCDRSCSGQFNGTHRLSPAKKPGPIKQPKCVKLAYSTLYKCTCKHCGIVWRNRFNVQFCDEHRDMYSHAGRAQFWFTFGISSYPDLFDGKLIKEHGMRSKENPNGVTRDHRVSVQEAILNGYNPYYIKHPLNCELMLFKDNASKHTKSSIDYYELVKMVDAYENK